MKDMCAPLKLETHWGGDTRALAGKAWPALRFRKIAVEPSREGQAKIKLTRNKGFVEKATMMSQQMIKAKEQARQWTWGDAWTHSSRCKTIQTHPATARLLPKPGTWALFGFSVQLQI